MKQEQNLQKVSFQLSDQWYENTIDLKKVYTSVHSKAKAYGCSANQLITEMFANLLDLAFQKKIELTFPFIITDYGCGRSKAANVLAEVVSDNADRISTALQNGKSISEILQEISPEIKKADEKEITYLPPTRTYDSITVQRYDIGIPEYSARPNHKANVVFCNDVFEHIPEPEIPAFINVLEESGKYIFASISLRDAVNYTAIPESLLLENAREVSSPTGIVLTKDISGDYIFSLHISVLPQSRWQELLGDRWTFLSAQDYTAVSVMNFQPSAEYMASKKELISKLGFADFIPFPTIIGSRYEKDPILWRRTALMQPSKHLQKLNALENYPDSAFKQKEMQESLDFFAFINAKIKKENGVWQIEELPEFLNKLRKLEELSKKDCSSNQEVQQKAKNLIKAINPQVS